MTSARIVFGVTAAMSARTFLTGQLHAFKDAGNEVHLLVGEGDASELARDEVVALHLARIPREPAPWADARGLVRVFKILRRIQPDTVVMGTPKMGLIGLVASRSLGVPRRIYLLHGLRAEGSSGVGRQVLLAMERLAISCATDVVAVSESLRTVVLDLGLVSPERICVLGSGSANGIDLDRFRPTGPERKKGVRDALGVPSDARVVAQVGRLCADKGLFLIPEVASRLTQESDVHFLLVGGVDQSDEQSLASLDALRAMPRVHLLGHTDSIEDIYSAADVLLLLTRREGLGNVLLEASASGIPVVATTATGTVDAVIDGVTGSLVPFEVGTVVDAVHSYIDEPARARTVGLAGREFVEDRFEQRAVWHRWIGFVDGSALGRRRDARAHR